MTRSLASALATDVGQPHAVKTELIELQFGDPVTQADWVRITTASQDLLVQPPPYAAAVTWAGIGGVINYDRLAETTDASGQQTTLEVSGVDQSIIAEIMAQTYLGRMCRIWYAHLSPTAGTVIADPIEMFRGWMNGGWTIEEDRDDAGGKVTVKCKLGTWMSGMRTQEGIFTNVQSHQRKAPGDTFFQNVPSLVNRKFYWGQPTPQYTGPPGPIDTRGWSPFGPF